MGCWNESCALSNIPIHEGDPVVVYLLANNPVSEERSNGDGCAFPFGFPIQGTYNDYGNVEAIKPNRLHDFMAQRLWDPILKSALDKQSPDRRQFIADRIARLEQGTFPSMLHVIEREMPALVIPRGHFYYTDGGSMARKDLDMPLTLWMAHLDLAETVKLLGLPHHSLHTLVNTFVDSLEAIKMGEGDPLRDDPRMFDTPYYMWLHRELFQDIVNAGLGAELREALIHTACLHKGMGLLRIPWRSGEYRGSSSDETKAHIYFHKFVTLHLEDYEKSQAEGADEDEVWEGAFRVGIDDVHVKDMFESQAHLRRLPR